MPKNDLICNLLEDVKAGSEESLEILYKKYFYFVERTTAMFDLKDQDKVYLIASNIVKKAIIDFSMNDNYGKYSICTFISNRLKKIIQNDNPIILKTRSKDMELEKHKSLAFAGDKDSKNYMFYRYQYIADVYAKDLYKHYVELVKCKSDNLKLLISVEDMMQDYYIMIWKFINNFYDDISNRNKYLSSILIKYIKDSHKTKIRRLEKNIMVEYLEDVHSYTYDVADDTLKNVEDKCFLDHLEQVIKSKNKDVLPLLRQGYTFEEAGQVLNCSKGTAHGVIDVCKRYVKKNKIQR